MSLTRRVTRALSSSTALFLVAVVGGAFSSLAFLGIGDSSHTFTACFRDADGLVGGNEVRVAGVVVGSVSSVTVGDTNAPPDCQQSAYVTMSVDAAHWPLRDGTAVAVKPKGVLSNVFVAVTPGDPREPSLGSAPYFPLAQTQSPVNLDELNNVFTPNVTEAIRTQLQEGVLAFGGAGAVQLNQTIGNVNPLTADAVPVTDVLATRSPQLDQLNFEFDTITGELAREDSNLRPLIVNLDTMLGALATKEQDLQGTLVHAASVLGVLDQGLSSPQTQQDLQRIFQLGPQSLSCAEALSGYLTPVIEQVNPHVSSLDVLLSEFITATGYNESTGTTNGASAGVDSLRIDPTLPPSGYTSVESGGLSQEHGTHYGNGPPLSLPAALPNGCAQVDGS
ncbi:MAG TPA: MlaD family protein [Dehalococcoidia bacterium]|nr:MlaD family protein [Dehalococcoidia bacterium]